jgi:hypothetical protein
MIPLRPYLYSGAAIAAVCGWLYVSHLQSSNDKLKGENKALNAVAAMRSVETRTVENYHTQTKVIRETVEKEADAVEAIPSDNLPDAVREQWLGSLRNVTNSAAADPDSAKPAR